MIVFAHHIAVLNGIQDKLGKTCNAVRIDGSTSMANRKQAMDDFQQKAHVKLAILSISAAGVKILSRQMLCLQLAAAHCCNSQNAPECCAYYVIYSFMSQHIVDCYQRH